ncbi:hypothetical protein KP509_21G003400 [Ceratopteris richardii]|nr:hypothetical protein KP509_21G003400 [Ceratopteris richardii]
MLKKGFEEYGPVKDVKVIMDKTTGKNKGYGFVTFKHRLSAIKALKEPTKKIDGRTTAFRLACEREADTKAAADSAPLLQVSPETAALSRKIYVGNVPKNIEKDTLREIFSKYGEIEEGPLGFDKKTGKCKGYTLIVYKSLDSVKKCLQEPIKTIEGHKVQCKIAESKKDKEEAMKLESALGYDVTNPALIASHNPSFLQSSSLGRFPSELSALHGIDPLLPQTASILGRDSAYGGSSLSSIYGLPRGAAFASSHPSLSSLHDPHGLGYSSLPRSGLF